MQSVTKSFNYVEYNVPCNTCKGVTYLHGKTPAGKQRYKCKNCNTTFINKYSYQSYEVSDRQIISQGRLLWIVYALQRGTNQVVDFAVGSRTKATLQKVISTLFLSNTEKIHTDKLNLYTFLIPSYLHNNKRYGTNHIERRNLAIRTHLKRLGRRTICYSKTIAMLSACLKIYFWS